jgi:hypothetical protein
LSIVDTTFVGNSSGRFGGAIVNSGVNKGTAALTVTNCTIADNISSGDVSGIYNTASSSYGSGIAKVTLSNTIFSVALGAGTSLYDDDQAGEVISLGSNLSSDAGGGFLNAAGDRRNTNPKLDPGGLRDNGGLTPTLALQANSPAIDAGNDKNAPATDQRGFSRVGRSDIGAFEFQKGIQPSATPTPTPTLTPTPKPSPTAIPTAQSQNISTRLNVLMGDNVMIGGFIVTGTAPKKVIIRAIGPSIPVTGAMRDPILELHKPGGGVVVNDNWKINDSTGQSQENEIRATTVPPADDRESALVETLPPGGYTALVRGKNGATGVALVEVYDLDSGANSQLANISTRGFVETGSDVMIGGFIVGPRTAASTKVVVRALGPSLPVNGALQDPLLELHNGNGTTMAINNNWRDDANAVEVQAVKLAPTDSRESALSRTLAPGAYTALVRGINNTTGVGLVEVYNLR